MMIGDRLKKVISITKTGFAIPVIIETRQQPSSSDVQELKGYMQVIRTSNIVNHVYGTADANAINALSSLPFISNIFYDEPVSRFGFGFSIPELPSISFSKTDIHIPITESARFIGAEKLHNKDVTGRGMKVAVIDTGVDSNHPMMQGAVTKQINIAKKNGAINADTDDGNGHGTHVATILAGREVIVTPRITGEQTRMIGVAPEAKVVGIKVLDDTGSGQTSWVMEGVEAAVAEGVDVINMSLGSSFDNAGLSPDSTLIDAVVFNKKIPCVVASGNSFANFTIGSPGGARGALTVASNAMISPMAGMVSTFSSKGATTDGRLKPDISAPGGNLQSKKETILAGTAGALAESVGDDYVGIMGTSMATPHVAGCVALLLQAGMSSDRFIMENLLAQTALFKHPKDIYTGWGMIDVNGAYDYIMSGGSLFPISSIFSELSKPFRPLASLMPKSAESVESSAVRLPYLF